MTGILTTKNKHTKNKNRDRHTQEEKMAETGVMLSQPGNAKDGQEASGAGRWEGPSPGASGGSVAL